MLYLLGLVIGALLVGAYFLFRDSMGLFQKVGRLYWITRNDMTKQPLIGRAVLRHIEPPYWRGSGIQFRFFKWTFHIGWLSGQGERLEDQISNIGWLPDVPGRVFRDKKWRWGEYVANKKAR